LFSSSAFTIERYLAVCHPLQTSFLSTTRRAIKIQILIWFIAILSSIPYFYMTKKLDHHCYFDQDFQFFARICFHISATIFFILPAFILCLLYALMAQRLYSVGLFNQVHWSKTSTTESYSSAICLQRMEHDNIGLKQKFKRHRPSPTSSVMIRYHPSIVRKKNNNSLRGSSTHIQSMKLSAFKMLCKYDL